MKRHRPQAEDFTVGWICPLPLEYAAAKDVLHELYDEAEYATGRIHNHEIVITCLPAGQMGTNAAAAATARMLAAFPNLKNALLVGIAGGVPSRQADIRLGDVVISQPNGQYGGVVQYDFGKTVPGGFQRVGSLNAPSHDLLTALSKLKSNLAAARDAINVSKAYQPPSNVDTLFQASYDHVGGETCAQCRRDMRVERVPRAGGTEIFFGTVASGNQVIKYGATRDGTSSKLDGVLCFEMEAAGVVNLVPCLVIRGICDYADSHKNKTFQPLAAAAAATCAREILLYLPHRPTVRNEQTEIPMRSWTEGRNHQNHRDPELHYEAQISQRQIYMESLRFDQMDSRHATIKMAHAKTCHWLINCQEHKNWLNPDCFDQHHGLFWIKGKPGAGKSTLLKFAFSQARKKMRDVNIVSFFFNARGEALEKTVLGMYRSLLWQLLEQLPDLQAVFDTSSVATGHGGPPTWSIETLKDLFCTAVEGLQDRSVICYIDALDECKQEEVQDMLSFFEQLGEIAASNRLRLLVCFSSRHYPHITVGNKVELVLEDQGDHHMDISKYVSTELKVGSSRQVQHIGEDIINRSSGIFLWAVLVVRILNEEYSRGHVHTLKRRLEEIPNGLHSLLKDILTRDNNNMAKTLLCLQWILYAKRPLKQEELYFAILAGTESSEFLADWTADQGEIDEEILKISMVDCSKGLAEMTKSKKNPTVQFIHESVRDFLRDEGLNNLEFGSIAPGPSHDALKACCLNYVTMDLSPRLPHSQHLPEAKSSEASHLVESVSRSYPFLEYAVQNVFHHANIAAEHGMAQEPFLAEFPTGNWILKNNIFEKHQVRRYSSSADKMYILAEHNWSKLLTIECSIGSPIVDSGQRHGHPVRAAIAGGHDEAACILLTYDASLRSDLDRLLSAASKKGCVATVGLLLELGASVDYKGRTTKTPLCHAAIGGHEPIVKILLEKNADTELSGPLSLASTPGVTRLLLESGAEPESRNILGETPLFDAASSCSIPRINLLLDSGAALESRDDDGRTALFCAAETHLGVEAIKVLLDRGADVESRDLEGRTPLSVAACQGWAENVKTLLDRGASIECKDDRGETPLFGAASAYFGLDVVNVLLDRSADIESKDGSGRTALSYAIESGRNGTIEALLERGADIESKDDSGRTALFYAIDSGRDDIFEALLERGSDIESKDDSGRTALFYAIDSGRDDIFEVLLERGSDIESKDNSGRSALFYAIENGQDDIFEVLLQRGADVVSKDYSGRTPLHYAASTSRHEVVKQLLTGGADLGAKDNDGQTPIDIARHSRSWSTLAILERRRKLRRRHKLVYSDSTR